MHNKEWKAKGCGQFDFLYQGLHGVIAIRAGRRAEIDQVAGVTKNTREATILAVFHKKRHVGWRMRRAHPPHVAFDENLHRLAADAVAALERFPHTAAGGHMSAKFHATEKILVNLGSRKALRRR